MKNKNVIIFGGIILIIIISLSVFIRPKISKAPTNIENKPIPFNKLDYITPKKLRKKIIDKENLILLDIRDSESFSEKHIENSINISKENLETVANKLPRNNTIVVISYNYDGNDVIEKIVEKLKNFGFSQILVLSGGISSWKKNENPLISGGNPKSVLDISKVSYLLPEQLKLAIDNKYPVFIIDVRPRIIFKQGHIPGAINIPFENLEENKNKIPFTKEIVAYGRNKLEDFKTGVKLYDMGFMASYLIKGGFSSWINKKFETEK